MSHTPREGEPVVFRIKRDGPLHAGVAVSRVDVFGHRVEDVAACCEDRLRGVASYYEAYDYRYGLGRRCRRPACAKAFGERDEADRPRRSI